MAEGYLQFENPPVKKIRSRWGFFNIPNIMTPLGTDFQVTKQNNNSRMNNENNCNDTYTAPSLYLQDAGTAGQAYKLIIQVDKIRARPGPKSKKRELMTTTANNYIQLKPCIEMPKKDVNDVIVEKEEVVIDVDSQSIATFQDENLTVSQEDDLIIKRNIQCSICHHSFDSTRSLYMHKQKHYVCQYCDIPCETKLLCENHEKMHHNMNPIFPYKCHLCSKTFDDKRNLKVHSKISHSETISIVGEKPTLTLNTYNILKKSRADKQKYRCEICRVVLTNEDAYRNHVVSHSVETTNIEDGDEAIHQVNSTFNHEESKKYSCKVCCKEFDTQKDADAHTYVHIEAIEPERKCNICKKIFKTEKMLNDHLAHHLSRAHHCVVCRKAFINRTTLKIHMRTHRNIK